MGGKLLGAGNGGYFIFYVPTFNKIDFIDKMNKNLALESFTFDNYGLRSWITKKKNNVDKVNFNSINKPIIIVEIGMNHNGSVKNAEKLIRGAKYAGADCVNFNYETLSSILRMHYISKMQILALSIK